MLYRRKNVMNPTTWPDIALPETSWNRDGDYTDAGMTSHDVEQGGRKLALLKYDWLINVAVLVAMATSLIGNVAVVYLICTRKRSRTAQSISVVSVCVAGVLVATFVMPSYLVIANEDAGGRADYRCRFLCKLEVYVWYWCKTVMAYSLCALVCDRYSLAFRPTERRAFSGRYVFFLSFVWFFGASYNIWDVVVTLSGYVTVVEPDGRNATLRRCTASARFGYIQKGVFYSDMLIIYVIPVLAVMYMYGAIVYHYYFKLDSPRQRINRNKVLLSLSLLFAFYVCQLPLEVMDAWGFFVGIETFELVLAKKMTEVLSFAHGFFNVLVYLAFSSDLRAICRRRCPRSPQRPYRRVVSAAGGASAKVPETRVNGADVSGTERQTPLEMEVIVIEGTI